MSRRPLGQAVSSLEKEEAVLEHICTYICTYVHTRIYIYTYIYACTRMLYLVPLYMFEMYLLYTGIYV